MAETRVEEVNAINRTIYTTLQEQQPAIFAEQKGKTLPQLAPDDTFEQVNPQYVEDTSFWQKVWGWFGWGASSVSSTPTQVQDVSSSFISNAKREKIEALSYVPTLEEPEELRRKVREEDLNPKSVQSLRKALKERPNLGFEHKVQLILLLLITSQENQSKIAEKGYKQNVDLAEVYSQRIQDLNLSLEFDNKIANVFGYAQTAVAIGTMACAGVILLASIPTVSIPLISGVAAFTSASGITKAGAAFTNAILIAGRGYFDYKVGEKNATIKDLSWNQDLFNEGVTSYVDQLKKNLENSKKLQEILYALAQQQHEMKELMLRPA